MESAAYRLAQGAGRDWVGAYEAAADYIMFSQTTVLHAPQ